MKVLCLNCQVLNEPQAGRDLCSLIRREKPSLVFLSETKLHSAATKSLIEKVLAGKEREFFGTYVDVRMSSGGAALLWLQDIQVMLLSKSSNHVDVEIDGGDDEPNSRFIGVYGWPETQNKLKTCELLRYLKPHSMQPWLIGGDLN